MKTRHTILALDKTYFVFMHCMSYYCGIKYLYLCRNLNNNMKFWTFTTLEGSFWKSSLTVRPEGSVWDTIASNNCSNTSFKLLADVWNRKIHLLYERKKKLILILWFTHLNACWIIVWSEYKQLVNARTYLIFSSWIVHHIITIFIFIIPISRLHKLIPRLQIYSPQLTCCLILLTVTLNY